MSNCTWQHQKYARPETTLVIYPETGGKHKRVLARPTLFSGTSESTTFRTQIVSNNLYIMEEVINKRTKH